MNAAGTQQQAIRTFRGTSSGNGPQRPCVQPLRFTKAEMKTQKATQEQTPVRTKVTGRKKASDDHSPDVTEIRKKLSRKCPMKTLKGCDMGLGRQLNGTSSCLAITKT